MGKAKAERLSDEELAAKIEWEGGTYATLEYGLAARDIADGETRARWKALVRGQRKVAAEIAEFDAWLEARNASG